MVNQNSWPEILFYGLEFGPNAVAEINRHLFQTETDEEDQSSFVYVVSFNYSLFDCFSGD